MWKTAWDITSANSGAKRLKNIPDVTSWAEGQIRQVLSSRPPAPSSRSALAERGGSAPLSAAQRWGVCGGVAPPPPRAAGPTSSQCSRRPAPARSWRAAGARRAWGPCRSRGQRDGGDLRIGGGGRNGRGDWSQIASPTLRGALLGWRHDSGVADEDVQGPRQAATNAAMEP